MATRKMKDISGALAEIAAELGISEDQLASMDTEEVRALVESGDLDPAQKARLIRTRLRKLRDEMDLAEDVLGDMAEDSGNGHKTPFGKAKSKNEYQDA